MKNLVYDSFSGKSFRYDGHIFIDRFVENFKNQDKRILSDKVVEYKELYLFERELAPDVFEEKPAIVSLFWDRTGVADIDFCLDDKTDEPIIRISFTMV